MAHSEQRGQHGLNVVQGDQSADVRSGWQRRVDLRVCGGWCEEVESIAWTRDPVAEPGGRDMVLGREHEYPVARLDGRWSGDVEVRAAGRVVVMRWLLVLALICAAPVYASGDPGIIDDDEPGMVGLLSGHGSTSVPAGPEWIARGCATRIGAALTSLTIPNVTVAANEVLIVSYGCRNPTTGGNGATTSTWGATAMNTPDNPGGTFAGASISGGHFYLRPGVSATSNVVIAFEALDAYTDLVGCAETVSIDSAYVGEIVQSGAAPNRPQADGLRTNHCNIGSFLIGACATQEAPSAPAGTWSNDTWVISNSEGGQRAGTTTLTPVTLATFHWIDVGDGGHCGEVVVDNFDILPDFFVCWYGDVYLP